LVKNKDRMAIHRLPRVRGVGSKRLAVIPRTTIGLAVQVKRLFGLLVLDLHRQHLQQQVELVFDSVNAFNHFVHDLFPFA